MDSLKGRLLISSAGLQDPNFRHTVVLVGEHNDEGALGVVLNRPLDLTVGEGVPELASLVGDEEILYQGGPVHPTRPVLVAEFTRPGLADLEVFGHIGFLIGEVSPDVRPDVVRARLFAGYSGWGPGQVEEEVREGSWILEPAGADDVFTDAPERLWARILRRKGPEYARLARVPFDLRVN